MKHKEKIPVTFPAEPFGNLGIDPILMDPLGSYTGVPREVWEVPVQDADDL